MRLIEWVLRLVSADPPAIVLLFKSPRVFNMLLGNPSLSQIDGAADGFIYNDPNRRKGDRHSFRDDISLS